MDELTKITDCKIKICDFSDAELLKQELADSAILTNGTSVGMAPHEDTCPVPEDLVFPDGLIVSDIIYNPRETRLSMAKHQGNPFFNGSYMLLYQGAEAFRLWTGKEMPVEQIKREFSPDKTVLQVLILHPGYAGFQKADEIRVAPPDFTGFFIYANNEPKSALARDLGDCRDNKGKLAKRVFTLLI